MGVDTLWTISAGDYDFVTRTTEGLDLSGWAVFALVLLFLMLLERRER